MKNKPEPTPDAWTLYRSMFKDGDFVVIVTDEDVFDWGKVKAEKHQVILKWPGRKNRKYEWEVVRFMAHDGFPIRKLMGADGKINVEKLDTSETTKAIRAALRATSLAACDWCGKPVGRTHDNLYGCSNGEKTYRHSRCFPVRYGDPFEIEVSDAVLLNPGNSGEDYWNEADEEVIVCGAVNGATGLLWDVSSIFAFGENP